MLLKVLRAILFLLPSLIVLIENGGDVPKKTIQD